MTETEIDRPRRELPDLRELTQARILLGKIRRGTSNAGGASISTRSCSRAAGGMVQYRQNSASSGIVRFDRRYRRCGERGGEPRGIRATAGSWAKTVSRGRAPSRSLAAAPRCCDCPRGWFVGHRGRDRRRASDTSNRSTASRNGHLGWSGGPCRSGSRGVGGPDRRTAQGTRLDPADRRTPRSLCSG